jgi:DNA-directed RNA polymerase specialized sigma subunit
VPTASSMLDSSASTRGSASPHEWRWISEIYNAIRTIESTRNRIATQAETALELGLDQSEYCNRILYLIRFAIPFLQPVGENHVTLLDCGMRESLVYSLPQSQAVRLLSDAILKMPKQERTVLSLCFKEKLNAAELARVMNTDAASASYLLAHAIFRLRSYLGSEWPASRPVN